MVRDAKTPYGPFWCEKCSGQEVPSTSVLFWAPRGTNSITQEAFLFSQSQIQHVIEEYIKKATHTHLSHPLYSQRSDAADICANFFVRLARKRTILKSRWPPSSTFFMNQKVPFAHTDFLSKGKLPVFLPSKYLFILLKCCFVPFPAKHSNQTK